MIVRKADYGGFRNFDFLNDTKDTCIYLIRMNRISEADLLNQKAAEWERVRSGKQKEEPMKKKRLYFVISFVVENSDDSPTSAVMDNIAENIEIDMVDTPEDPGQSINLSGPGIVISKPRFEDVSDVNPM